MDARDMERFWDRCAQEDPFHYVDDRQPLGSPDLEAFWRGGAEAIDELLGALGVSLDTKDDVLEIGCGIGRLTRSLAARVRAVYALDISGAMIERARQYNHDLSNVEWIQGDGETLAMLPDGSVDACVSFVVFQHIPDPAITLGYIREIGRVLRPGGWTAFQISNDSGLHIRRRGIHRLRKELTTLIGSGSRRRNDPAWIGSSVTIDELRSVASESNLTLERVENEASQFCFVLARRVRSSNAKSTLTPAAG